MPGEARRFVAELFGSDFPDKLHAALWDKAGGKRNHLIASPDAADTFEGKPDVYVGASLVGDVTGGRVKARDSRGIGGLWLDVDLPGPEDPPTKKPAPDEGAARELLCSVCEPTLIVHSGYGLQAWWLFDEPWLFGGDDEHAQAARIAQGWEVMHRNRAMRLGWTIDSVHDLARVMRLPGTLNGKGGTTKPVLLLEDEGSRYDVETLAGHALLHAPIQARVEASSINVGGPLPMAKFDALLALDENFRKTFEHTRRDRAVDSWSTSHWDLALASMVARRGWTDDEIAALVTYHRQKQNGDGDQKATRGDYLEKTIAKARTGQQREERTELVEQALDDLAAIGEGSHDADPDTVFGLFNGVLGAGIEGAPVIRELVQFSDDPDQARYVFVLADGQEVNVGPYENLRQPRRLDSRIGPATGFVMETIKDNDVWRAAVRALLKVRTLREEPEEPVVEWVQRYAEDNLGSDREQAAKGGHPFEEDGRIYVKTEGLAWFVRTVLRERTIGTAADLRPLLRRAGFEQQRIHYHREGGKRTTANYWCIDKREVA